MSLPDVWEGSEDPLLGVGWVRSPSRRPGRGREALPKIQKALLEIWEATLEVREALLEVWEWSRGPSWRSERGQEYLLKVWEGSGGLP